jgi:hypothetical protein
MNPIVGTGLRVQGGGVFILMSNFYFYFATADSDENE